MEEHKNNLHRVSTPPRLWRRHTLDITKCFLYFHVTATRWGGTPNLAGRAEQPPALAVSIGICDSGWIGIVNHRPSSAYGHGAVQSWPLVSCPWEPIVRIPSTWYPLRRPSPPPCRTKVPAGQAVLVSNLQHQHKVPSTLWTLARSSLEDWLVRLDLFNDDTSFRTY